MRMSGQLTAHCKYFLISEFFFCNSTHNIGKCHLALFEADPGDSGLRNQRKSPYFLLTAIAVNNKEYSIYDLEDSCLFHYPQSWQTSQGK